MKTGEVLDTVPSVGSPAFVVLSDKEKAERAGLVRQPTPPHCVRDDFLGETSLDAVLHWLLGGSTQWLSTGNAEEPTLGMVSPKTAKPSKKSHISSTPFIVSAI
jgi:hypothetical protein